MTVVNRQAGAPSYAGRVQTSNPKTSDDRSVTRCLETEHSDLAAVAANLRALITAARFEEATVVSEDFARRLDRHIDAEERVLFPVFEEITGLAGGPTAILRCEHCMIRKVLAVLVYAIAKARGDEADALLDCLGDILATHNVKEETVLYPICNRAIRDDAVREIILYRIAECRAPTNATEATK